MVVVQKFGGTSVGNTEKIRHVARRVLETRRQGKEVVVVVSAMNGETDRLLKTAGKISLTPDAIALDALLATGEQASVALLAVALHSLGASPRMFYAHQIPLLTDSAHGKASVLGVQTTEIAEALAQRKIPVIAGFQGISPNGEMTTLGRGGSDITAVALAAALGASECEFYKDVDGVYSMDPHSFTGATKFDFLPYEQMVSMANGGAKVLNAESVRLAQEHGIPLHVRHTFSSSEGTRIGSLIA